MTYRPGDLEDRIWAALRNNGPLSTAELAAEVGEETKTVYQRCRTMQRHARKYMRSTTREGDRPLYFFPATGDVLTNTSYKRIGKVMHDLRDIAHRHPVKRGKQLPEATKKALKRDYTMYLDGLAARSKGAEREQIQAFEGQLMAVLSGTRLSDILGMTGVRPFRPMIRVWQRLPKAPERFASAAGLPGNGGGEPPPPRDRF